jgi:hypothetical protein
VRVAAANLGEEFHTADAGHVEVGNDRTESLAPQSQKGFLTAGGGGAVKSGWTQHEGEKLASRKIVINGKNARSRLTIR